MSTIRIEKYVEGSCVETICLPVAPLRFLTKIIPGKAKLELMRLGLDVEKILAEGMVLPAEYWIDVEENKVPKRIRVVRQT